MGIFNVGAPFPSDLNLIFQAVIAVFLVLAVATIAKKKYLIHGVTMGTCVVLHSISIFAIMLPSLLSLHGLIKNFSTRLSILVVTHVFVGSAVEILGVLLVLAWVFNGTRIENCFRRKYFMKATIILWFAELILGFLIYLMLYPFV